MQKGGNKMKTKLLALALLAGSSAFAATRFSVGIGIGGYAPGGYYAEPQVAIPPYPGPGYSWIDGYWAPNGAWIAGYWRAPFVRGYGFAPRYDERVFGRRDFDRDRDFAPRYNERVFSHRGFDRDHDQGRVFNRGDDHNARNNG